MANVTRPAAYRLAAGPFLFLHGSPCAVSISLDSSSEDGRAQSAQKRGIVTLLARSQTTMGICEANLFGDL